MAENGEHTNRVVYVVDGARTPFMKASEPGPFSASDLAVYAGRALFAKLPVDASQVDEVIIGCVNPSEEEANIGRIIGLRLGTGHEVPAWTVQRNCASGLQAVDSGATQILTGKSEMVLVGGTEVMSRAPLMFQRSMATFLARLNRAKRVDQKLKTALQFRPNMLVPIIALLKGLTDPVINMNMGQTAEELAYRFGLSRRTLDEFASRSHHQAMAASALLAEQVTPVFSDKGHVFDTDNGVRQDSTADKLAKLRPVFEKHGSITAGNSSQITDGACMLLLASEAAVKKHNLPVLGKITDSAWAGLDPAIMGLGPALAIPKIMARQKLTFDALDLVEINEAFAAQVLSCVAAMNDQAFCQTHFDTQGFGQLSLDQVNPSGGAIALGHPVGASGARLVYQALSQLKANNQSRAMVSLCIGGGQGGAMLLERSQ